MRPKAIAKGKWRYYMCRSKDFGYDCEQRSVRVETVDDQVVSVLMNLKPPQDWRKGITKAMGEMLGEKNLDERIEEIKAIIQRMDTRWDHGFVTNEDEYLQQRIKLQMELEQLTPVADDELEQAADMLKNFRMHWERLERDEEGRHELIKLIVERVYIEEDKVVAMTLRSNYHLVLNHKTNEPTEFTVDPLLSTSGSDGLRGLTCIILVFLPRHIPQKYLSEIQSSPNMLALFQNKYRSMLSNNLLAKYNIS